MGRSVLVAVVAALFAITGGSSALANPKSDASEMIVLPAAAAAEPSATQVPAVAAEATKAEAAVKARLEADYG